MSPATPYAIRGGAAGRERLRVLGRVLQPGTEALFDRLGVGPGWTCLDVGCGGGDVARVLARRVGASGRVVGVDLDAEKLALARQEADAEGCAHVSFQPLDVRAEALGETFDLVYARFLLSHLGDPIEDARWLCAHAKPGGLVAVEDVDFAGHFVAPRSDAFDRYVALYEAVVRGRGGDPHLGPRLPRLLLDAGLEAVDAGVVQPVGLRGDAKRLNPLTMANIADAVVADGLATRDEVDALVTALEAYADDETTLAGLPRIVQAWGRRPRDGDA
jgi:SAM-dependent methyltransferase